MPIELTLRRAHGVSLDSTKVKIGLKSLFTGISFEETEDPQIRFEQLKALKTPDVILKRYEGMTRNFQGVVETEAGSIFVEFPSREPVDSVLVEVRGDDLHVGIIRKLIKSKDWILQNADGEEITNL